MVQRLALVVGLALVWLSLGCTYTATIVEPESRLPDGDLKPRSKVKLFYPTSLPDWTFRYEIDWQTTCEVPAGAALTQALPKQLAEASTGVAVETYERDRPTPDFADYEVAVFVYGPVGSGVHTRFGGVPDHEEVTFSFHAKVTPKGGTEEDLQLRSRKEVANGSIFKSGFRDGAGHALADCLSETFLKLKTSVLAASPGAAPAPSPGR